MHEVLGNTRDMRLTSKEKQILDLVNRGLSSREIGENLGCKTGTVNTYRSIIRKKLGPQLDPEVLIEAERLLDAERRRVSGDSLSVAESLKLLPEIARAALRSPKRSSDIKTLAHSKNTFFMIKEVAASGSYTEKHASIAFISGYLSVQFSIIAEKASDMYVPAMKWLAHEGKKPKDGEPYLPQVYGRLALAAESVSSALSQQYLDSRARAEYPPEVPEASQAA
jgi:DNA-binding CsgD family transcriptional regulator